MLKLCLVIILASAALAWSPPVFAQEGDATFDANVSKGVESYKARKYVAAIKYFRDAYAIKTDPTLIFNIARSYERLGKVEDALANYQAYVDAPGTTSEDRADALSRIKALRQEQAAREAAEEPAAPVLPAESTRVEPVRTEPVPETLSKVDRDPKTNGATPVKKSTLVVIVHKSNTVPFVSKSQLADIYFGRSSTWPNGARLRPVVRPRGTEAGRIFFSSTVGIDPGKYSRHWQQKQLSGAGLAPASAESTAAVIKAVAAHPGAIGFLSADEVPANMDGVRVVELR
jgi:hypothetical protein